jgi:D-aspartate ligase
VALGRRRRVLGLDTSVGLVVIKVGEYPLHHGGLHAIRSMGRVGVPAYAMTEGRLTPVALSRYLTAAVVSPTSHADSDEVLLDTLVRVGRQIGRRSIALPTDDEASILVAEHRAELDEWFVIPEVPAGLPRMVASKRGLVESCSAHGVPAPAAAFPTTLDDVAEFAARVTFPVVVKNVTPWLRWTAPAVGSSLLVRTGAELLALARTWAAPMDAILQEYIPSDGTNDWIYQGYFDAASRCRVGFTGVKYRSWPPGFGVATYGRARSNEALRALAAGFATRLGYRGPVDMDWRYDPRDGQYKLLDFNPRIGANFSMFETDAGIDVVRAMHLDLTGRSIPAGIMNEGQGIIVENLDVPSRFSSRRQGRPRAPKSGEAKARLSWVAVDDPLPAAATAVFSCGAAAAKLGGALRHRDARRG